MRRKWRRYLSLGEDLMSWLGFHGVEFDADSRVGVAQPGLLESRKAKSYIDRVQMIGPTLAVVHNLQ